MMDIFSKEDLAARLNGREYGNEITEDEERLAEEHNLVVVFGYSDDCCELRGAIHDELSCYDGGEFHVNSNGLLINKCDYGDCPHYRREARRAHKVEIVWDSDGYSWVYKTDDVPHSSFEIIEDGEPFCRGIVFALYDLRS